MDRSKHKLYEDNNVSNKVGGSKKGSSMLRYADDFVILSNELEVLSNIKNAIEEILRVRGLELSHEKN